MLRNNRNELVTKKSDRNLNHRNFPLVFKKKINGDDISREDYSSQEFSYLELNLTNTA